MVVKKTSKEIAAAICNDYAENKLATTSEMAKKYDLSLVTVSKILKEGGIKSHRGKKHWLLDETFFEKIDTEERAYFLGLLYADGCINKDLCSFRIVLHHKDREILQKLSIILYGEDYTSLNRSAKWDDCYCLRARSKKMVSDLVNLGCGPRKTFVLNYPTDKVPQKLRKHFARGYLDGDGSIGLVKKHLQGYVHYIGTKSVLDGLSKDVEFSCNKTFVHTDNVMKNGIIWNYSWRGNECLFIADYLYRDCTIKMERKWLRFLTFIKKKVNTTPRYNRLNEKQQAIVDYYTPFLEGIDLPKYKWET